MQGSAITEDGSFKLKVLALGHDRQSVVASVTAEDDLIPSLGTAGRYIHSALNHANAGRGDEDLVSLAPIDDFGIAGHELYIRFRCCCTHRFNHPSQVVNRQSFLEDERCGQVK